MAMVDITFLDSYYEFDTQINDIWVSLSADEQNRLIGIAEKRISKLNFIGKKTDSTQSDVFPRNYDQTLDAIECYYLLQDIDDVKQLYEDNNDIVPNDVKEAIAEQIKYMLLTEDFYHERALNEKYKIEQTVEGVKITGNFAELNQYALELLLPFRCSPMGGRGVYVL